MLPGVGSEIIERVSNSRSKKLLAVLAAVALATATFVLGLALGASGPDEGSYFDLLEEAEGQIRSLALTEPDREELRESALKGMLQGLDDPHALYYTPEAYRMLSQELLTGQFSGVGIWLNHAEELVKVVSVLPDTPASEAGIVPGDIVTAVDGEPVAGLGLEEVSQRIQGEAGTDVVVTVVRAAAAPEDFLLHRRQLEIVSLTTFEQANVGVLNLVSFTGGVGDKVREAVARMQDEGVRGFVLDLRGNPGGSLDEAVQVASVFLEGGPVVTYRERSGPEVLHEARPPAQTQLPLVVLVDAGSASASEIVAGAIQDRERGLVVGTETYRKGSVQRLVGLSDGSALKLTVASYYTPSGRGIGEHGIIPDVTVTERDQQLERAAEIVSGMLAAGPRQG